MTTPTAQDERFCLTCRYALRGVTSRTCPECGRAFDPDDPRTTARSQMPGIWVSLAQTGRALVIGSGVLTGIAFFYAALGYDPMFAWLVGFAVTPLLVLVLVVIAIPRVPLRRRVRVMGVLFPLLLASIIWTYWPFSVTFRLHRSAMQTVVDGVRSGTPVVGPLQVGVFSFRQVRQRPNGNIGFQLTGGGGGGTFLVRQATSRGPIWVNTNWERDLGGGWYYVDQD